MFTKKKIQGLIIQLHKIIFTYKIASGKHFTFNKYQTIIDPFKPSFAII